MPPPPTPVTRSYRDGWIPMRGGRPRSGATLPEWKPTGRGSQLKVTVRITASVECFMQYLLAGPLPPSEQDDDSPPPGS